MMVLDFIMVGTDDGVVGGASIDKIIFNQVPLLQINFFEEVDSSVTNADTINGIRSNIAIWYVSLRNLAAVILAIMVLYVGIRMAIASVAEEKAKYKKMLADWVVSLVLLFVLHYIMIFIIQLNNSLVEVLYRAQQQSANGFAIGNAMDQFFVGAWALLFTKAFTNTIIYFMLCVMTFIFFITYVKRMITIAFLIMIAPIITVTYSLDRMGDGKSQALNKWFKEFVYNILLQPFQCIIYMALVEASLATIDPGFGESISIASAVIGILMIIFMYEAENIVKEIFHFESKSVASTIGQAAVVTSALGLIGKSSSKKSSGGSSSGRKKTTPNTKPTPPNAPTPPNTPTPPNPQINPSTSKPTLGGTIITGAKSLGRRALKAGTNEVKKLPREIMFAAAGMATGNLNAEITGFQTGRGSAESKIARHEVEDELFSLATAYNRMENEYLSRGRDQDWIRQHTKDLLNGDVAPEDYEKEYFRSAMKMKDFYMENGLSDEDAVTAVDKDIGGIQSGTIGEMTTRQYFRGKKDDVGRKIREILNNRKNNNNP